MQKLYSLSMFSLALSVACGSDVVLSGTATDCFQANRIQALGVAVAAFDPTSNQPMLDLVRTMDTASFADTDPEAMTRFLAKHDRLISLEETSTALARATSDSSGNFELTVAARDSILVMGHAAREDEPFYYGSVMIGGRTNSRFVLDMSGGGCGHLNP